MKKKSALTQKKNCSGRSKSVTLALHISIAGLSATNVVHAAETPSREQEGIASTLPMISVQADAERESATSPVRGFVAGRSTSGVKTDTSILEIPQSISVVTNDEIEAKGMRDLQDVLLYTPGVFPRTYGHDDRGYSFGSMRGFQNTNFTQYQDGIPLLGFTDIAPMTEVYGLERVEVLRGPASATYGQGDVGGIVNRVSKRPSFKNPVREVRAQFGNFRHKQAAFDFGDSIGDTLSFRVVGLARNGDDQAKYPGGKSTKTSREYFAPSLRWQPSPMTSVTLLASAIRHSSGDDYGFELDADGNPTNVRQGDPNFSRIVQKSWNIGYEASHDFNDTWGLRQNFRFSDRRVNKRHIRPAELQGDGRTITRSAVHAIGGAQQATLDTYGEGKVSTGPITHRIIAGLDWTKLEGKINEYGGSAPDLDLINPVYLPIPMPNSILGMDGPYKLNSVGLYVQDQMKFADRWLLTVSGRRDTADAKVSPLDGELKKNKDRALTGRAGLTYLASNGWAPYISFGTSFQPAIDVYDDFEAKSTKGKQWEAGVKYQPANTKLLFTGAVYDLKKTNMVVTNPVTTLSEQVGAMQSRGLELELKGEIARGLTLTSAYSYIDAKGRKGDTWYVQEGKAPVLIPKHMASLWLNYRMSSPTSNELNYGVGARYVGKRWNDAANTSSQGTYTLFDASIRYNVDAHWRVALNATNLFDRRYFVSGLGSWDRGERRTVTATVSYLW